MLHLGASNDPCGKGVLLRGMLSSMQTAHTQLGHSQCPSGFALALCPTLLSDQEKVMSQPRKSLYKPLEYIPLPSAMQVCNAATQFTCTPDKTSWFENALSVFGDLAGRALQGVLTQSSLCLLSDGPRMPGADQQLLDQISSSLHG